MSPTGTVFPHRAWIYVHPLPCYTSISIASTLCLTPAGHGSMFIPYRVILALAHSVSYIGRAWIYIHPLPCYTSNSIASTLFLTPAGHGSMFILYHVILALA